MFLLQQFLEFGQQLLKAIAYMAPVASLNRQLSSTKSIYFPELWRITTIEIYLEYENIRSTYVACNRGQ